MRKVIFLLTALAAFSFGGQSVSAEVKTFHAENSYLMDKGEPIKDAQDYVFKDAVRNISEQAGVVVKALSQSKDSELELDRVENFTAAVLRIKSKTFGKELTSDGGLKITVAVDAELDTDNAAELLNELREAKKSAKGYEEVLKDYTKRKNQFDTVYGEYLGSYQKRIMRTIRDGCKLQSDGKLDEALKLYDAAIAESVANNAELSLAYVKRGHVYKLQNKTELALDDFKRALVLNNDAVGIHFIKGLMAEADGKNSQAAQEYRAFVKDADIIYYDVEIIFALDRIVELKEAN
ncbi:MAG: hypothetical protein II968_04630 [Selenomonadaceae bacterium]|nr:hypothetical protein [Selenomonadaceae bacterium]